MESEGSNVKNSVAKLLNSCLLNKLKLLFCIRLGPHDIYDTCCLVITSLVDSHKYLVSEKYKYQYTTIFINAYTTILFNFNFFVQKGGRLLIYSTCLYGPRSCSIFNCFGLSIQLHKEKKYKIFIFFIIFTIKM